MEEKVKGGISANVLRVLATMFVFLLHGKIFAVDGNMLPPAFHIATQFPAWAGVWIFVLLSGYGIGCAFFSGRYKLEDMSGKYSLKLHIKFYWDRFFKLIPIYYIYLLFFEVLNGQHFFFSDKRTFLECLFFVFNGNGGINGMGHLWYVSVAMQLYFLMPFMYMLLKKIQDKKIPLIITLVVLLILGIVERHVLDANDYNWYKYIYTNCFCNLDLCAAGMICACLKTRHPVKFKFKKTALFVAWALFIALVIYNLNVYAADTEEGYDIYQFVLPTFYGLFCSLILIFSGYGPAKFRTSPVAKVINSFSGLSYAFYIFHIACFMYVEIIQQNSTYAGFTEVGKYFTFLIISFVLTIVCAIPLNYLSKVINKEYRDSKFYAFLSKKN